MWKVLAPGANSEERWNPEHVDPTALAEAVIKVADLHQNKEGKKGTLATKRKKKDLEEWVKRR